MALQIHKTLKYAVVDLKPPNIYHGRALEIATILIGQRRKWKGMDLGQNSDLARVSVSRQGFMDLFWTRLSNINNNKHACFKGQLIWLQKLTLSSSFLEELKTLKFPFEINWPLALDPHMNQNISIRKKSSIKKCCFLTTIWYFKFWPFQGPFSWLF